MRTGVGHRSRAGGRRKAAIAALALAFLTQACSLFRTATHVEQGQLYATGNTTYDEFFTSLHALHEDATRAREDAAKARAPLAKALNVDEKAEGEDALHAAESSAKKLREANVFLHLQLTPETKVLAVHGGALPADAETFIQGMESATKGCLDLSLKLGGFQEKAQELERKRADLLGRTKTELHEITPVKREEIARELDAAEGVIAEDAEKLALYAGSASKFVVDLARVVETGGSKAAPEAPPDAVASAAKSAKPRSKWTGAPRPQAAAAPAKPAGGGATKPAGGGATKPAAAPKKHGGGDDFEP